MGYIVSSQRLALAPPTQTARESYRIAGEELTLELGKLRKILEGDLKNLEKALEDAGAPYTPGRLPQWRDPGMKAAPGRQEKGTAVLPKKE